MILVDWIYDNKYGYINIMNFLVGYDFILNKSLVCIE